MAAAVVDNRYIGRLRLQILGFIMVAVLFYVSAIWYHPLTSKGGIHSFQFVRPSLSQTPCPLLRAQGISDLCLPHYALQIILLCSVYLVT